MHKQTFYFKTTFMVIQPNKGLAYPFRKPEKGPMETK